MNPDDVRPVLSALERLVTETASEYGIRLNPEAAVAWNLDDEDERDAAILAAYHRIKELLMPPGTPQQAQDERSPAK